MNLHPDQVESPAVKGALSALTLAFAKEAMLIGSKAIELNYTDPENIGGLASGNFASGIVWLRAILRHREKLGLTEDQILDTLAAAIDKINCSFPTEPS